MNIALYTILLVSFIANPVYAANFKPGPETSFTLIKPLIIPGGTASVFIQKNIATRNEALINQYYANCRFQQYPLARGDQLIQPDRFIVSASRLSRDPVTRGSYEYITLFYLVAEKSKKKYTLECQHWGDWADRYLTREEIQAALNEYFKITP